MSKHDRRHGGFVREPGFRMPPRQDPGADSSQPTQVVLDANAQGGFDQLGQDAALLGTVRAQPPVPGDYSDYESPIK